jgi:hypothetical protein
MEFTEFLPYGLFAHMTIQKVNDLINYATNIPPIELKEA